MSRAHTHPPPRQHPPLSPPRLGEGAHERVADALRRRRKTHVPLTDDEQRPLFTDASDEADVPSLGGRLVVPEDTEL